MKNLHINKFVNVVLKLFDLVIHFVVCIIIIFILKLMPLINVTLKKITLLCIQKIQSLKVY